MGFVEVANGPFDDVVSEQSGKRLGPFIDVLSVLDEMGNQDFKDANPLGHEDHEKQELLPVCPDDPLLPLPCPGVLLTSAQTTSKTLLSTPHFSNIIASLP